MQPLYSVEVDNSSALLSNLELVNKRGQNLLESDHMINH